MFVTDMTACMSVNWRRGNSVLATTSGGPPKGGMLGASLLGIKWLQHEADNVCALFKRTDSCFVLTPM